MHENESVRRKPIPKSFLQPARTLSVDHASDAMTDCVHETTHRVLDGGSLLHRIPLQHEQDYGNIAKGCEEESTIKDDTHQRRGHNIHRPTVVSFNAETDFSGKKKSSCQETQTESDPNYK